MNSVKISKLICLLLVFNLFLMRPAALGQSYTPAAMIFSCILIIFHFLIGNINNIKKVVVSNDFLQLIFLFLIYWIYVIFISIYYGKSDLTLLIKELLAASVVVFCYLIFLSDINLNKLFFKQLSLLMGLIGFSVLFTSVWGVFFDVDSLYLFPIKVAGYEDTNSDLQLGTGAIYFPFSMLYGEFSSEDFVLYRFSGFFREAGIYQAVGCFCLAYESFTRNSKIIKFGLISGIICALSSAGIVMLFLTIGMIYLYGSKFSHKKLIVIIFSFIFLYPAALYTPLIGLNYKKDTHSESITDRVESVDDGINSIKDNFFGNGLFSATKKNAGINMIADLGSFGVFGFLMQFLIISGTRFRGNSNLWKKLSACLPLLVTAIFSQPIAGSPMIYVLVMVFIPFVWMDKNLIN